jgi:hypothetical protein
MNRFLPILATIEMSENDKRALIALVIILVILFVLIGLLGMAVRKTMEYQGKRADTLMHDVTITKVVTTPLQFRVLGRKKNHRLLYRHSLWPFLVALTGLIIWIIASLAMRNWTENIFADFGDLFFLFNWNAEGVWTSVFGLTLLAKFPPLSQNPHIVPEHIASYFEVTFFLVAAGWYLVVVQAFISRAFMIQKRSRDVFSKSLKDYKANDVDTSKLPPLPPSD